MFFVIIYGKSCRPHFVDFYEIFNIYKQYRKNNKIMYKLMYNINQCHLCHHIKNN